MILQVTNNQITSELIRIRRPEGCPSALKNQSITKYVINQSEVRISATYPSGVTLKSSKTFNQKEVKISAVLGYADRKLTTMAAQTPSVIFAQLTVSEISLQKLFLHERISSKPFFQKRISSILYRHEDFVRQGRKDKSTCVRIVFLETSRAMNFETSLSFHVSFRSDVKTYNNAGTIN